MSRNRKKTLGAQQTVFQKDSGNYWNKRHLMLDEVDEDENIDLPSRWFSERTFMTVGKSMREIVDHDEE